MKQLTESEANALIAEKVMGLKYAYPRFGKEFGRWQPVGAEPPVNGFKDPTITLPDYLRSAEASKALRDALAERWDTNLGSANVAAFALWPKGTTDKLVPPTHIATADTEYKAVALCALRSIGEDVDIV